MFNLQKQAALRQQLIECSDEARLFMAKELLGDQNIRIELKLPDVHHIEKENRELSQENKELNLINEKLENDISYYHKKLSAKVYFFPLIMLAIPFFCPAISVFLYDGLVRFFEVKFIKGLQYFMPLMLFVSSFVGAFFIIFCLRYMTKKNRDAEDTEHFKIVVYVVAVIFLSVLVTTISGYIYGGWYAQITYYYKLSFDGIKIWLWWLSAILGVIPGLLFFRSAKNHFNF